MSGRGVKQIIILRKDLNMRKGKMVAQGAHASMAAVFDHHESHLALRVIRFAYKLIVNTAMRQWFIGAFKKITVSVNSEEELLAVYQKAKDAGLLTSLIVDSGLTEFNGVPTKTAVAIGPAYDDELAPLTGTLPLL